LVTAVAVVSAVAVVDALVDARSSLGEAAASSDGAGPAPVVRTSPLASRPAITVRRRAFGVSFMAGLLRAGGLLLLPASVPTR
jgi:hypothetical protein